MLAASQPTKKENAMKTKVAGFVLMAMVAGSVNAVMYEWKDPATGKYKAGDKPPAGVQHWIDGQRPQPKSEPSPQKTPSSSSVMNEACNGLRPLARAAFNAKKNGVPLSSAENLAPKNLGPGTNEVLRSVVRSVYRHGTSEQQSDELVYQACLLTYGAPK